MKRISQFVLSRVSDKTSYSLAILYPFLSSPFLGHTLRMLYALLLSLPKASEEIIAGSVVEVDFLDFGIQLALFRARTHGEIIGNKKHLRRKCGGRKLFALDKKKKKKKKSWMRS